MTTFTTIQKELFTHFKIVIANEKNCQFKNFKTSYFVRYKENLHITLFDTEENWKGKIGNRKVQKERKEQEKNRKKEMDWETIEL